MTDQQRLEQLVRARYPCICIVTHEEQYALSLIRETAIRMNRDVWLWSVVDGVQDGMIAQSRPIPDTDNPGAALYYLAKTDSAENKSFCVTLDLAEHLGDQRTLRALRNLIEQFRHTGSILIMIDHHHRLPAVISACATRFEISLPDEEELETIVRNTLRNFHRQNPIEVNITRRDLETILRNLKGLTRRQAEQVILDVISEDRRFDADDINAVLARKRQMIHSGGLLQYVETPVDLSQIGGLRRLKQWLAQRQNAMTRDADQFGISHPRGVLMLGVQGAGKSLCAKAIATAWRQPLLRLDPGTLYDRYVGESERRLRDALRQAEMMAPIVLWIDEIEKAFASAASRSTDGGLSQRMFGTLLTWMQEHEAPVFLVATANDIEALPPELLRKGRFDEIFFVDLPGTDTRRDIFEIHLRKRQRDPAQFDLDKLADASEGYSGAEIEQAIVSALHNAFAHRGDIDTNRVLEALKASAPLSVIMAERVEALRAWASGRCVPAD